MNKNDVTILVNSCDLYEDTWYPFFRLLQIQWPDCPYKIVLNTETKKYDCPFMNVETFNSGAGLSWTARLRKALNSIDTEYVLFFLEDFFITENVNSNLFLQAVELLDNNPKIGRINFPQSRINDTFKDVSGEECYYKKLDKKAKRKTDVIVSLWRKDYFLKLLYGDENPWQYEIESDIRARYAGCEIYSQRYSVSSPVFNYYINPADGIGITAGKWLKGNKILFEKYGINDVIFSNLGVFDKEITYTELKKEKAKKQMESLSTAKKIKELIYNFIRDFKKKTKIKGIKLLKKHLKYWWYYKNYN